MAEFLPSYRIVTFVPEENAADFIKQLSPYIPAFLGDYEHVLWWSAPGTEQSKPLNESRAKQLPSIRLECSIPQNDQDLEKISYKIKELHPWQEPVILVFESRILCPKPGKNQP